MAKYTPLSNYLSTLPKTTRDITLTFDQIEQVIHTKLPKSAYQYQAWWANERRGRHVEAHAWLEAGWLVETVNLVSKWVRLRR